MVPALFGVTHGAVHFMFYEKMKLWRLQQLRQSMPQGGKKPSGEETDKAFLEGPEKEQAETLTNWDYISLSALSKVTAGALTYPYQVIRARLQIYDAEQEYKSARDVIAKVWRTEGGRGFYKGWVIPSISRDFSTCKYPGSYGPENLCDSLGAPVILFFFFSPISYFLLLSLLFY